MVSKSKNIIWSPFNSSSLKNFSFISFCNLDMLNFSYSFNRAYEEWTRKLVEYSWTKLKWFFFNFAYTFFHKMIKSQRTFLYEHLIYEFSVVYCQKIQMQSQTMFFFAQLEWYFYCFSKTLSTEVQYNIFRICFRICISILYYFSSNR